MEVLIIGYGSAGKRHAEVLNSFKIIKHQFNPYSGQAALNLPNKFSPYISEAPENQSCSNSSERSIAA